MTAVSAALASGATARGALADANEARRRAAADRDADLAVLMLRRDLTVREAAVARGRRDSPGLCWAQLAAELGITKSQASTAWRRMLAKLED